MEQLSFVVPFGVIGKTVTAPERRCPAPAEHERAGTPLYGLHGALRLRCLGGSIGSLALLRSRLGATRPKSIGEWAIDLANGDSSLVVPADNGPMQGLTRSPSLPLQSGFTLCPLGRFTGLLGQALFLLGPALFAFGRFARQLLGG